MKECNYRLCGAISMMNYDVFRSINNLIFIHVRLYHFKIADINIDFFIRFQ